MDEYTLILVESTQMIANKTTLNQRFYISSLIDIKAQAYNDLVQNHCGAARVVN